MALQNLLWGLGQPVAGAVADRFGPGRVLTAGAVLYAAGTALMAVSTSPIALHLSGGVLLGLGVAGSAVFLAAPPSPPPGAPPPRSARGRAAGPAGGVGPRDG